MGTYMHIFYLILCIYIYMIHYVDITVPVPGTGYPYEDQIKTYQGT